MVVRDLDIGLLRTFLAVADRENFAGAADQVFRTQAAVSQQMQRLERLLDCKLLVRVGRHKRLTEEGVRLREYARRMLALNDETCRAMNQSVFAAPTRIGVCADAVDTILPDYLALCARTYPGMRIEIQVNRSRWLASALRRGDIDLLLELEQFDEFPRITFRTSPVVWISGTHFHHQQNHPLPLVLVDSPCVFRRMALNRLEQKNRPWRNAFQTPTLAGVRAALRAGLGITPRTIEMLTPGLKVVGEELGLPVLPSASYHLYMRAGDCPDGARKLSELFIPP